jgi:hypothetical protein
MILLDHPYVSDFLKQTIVENQLPVVATPEALALMGGAIVNWLPESEAVQALKDNYGGPIYTNSENAITWIQQHAPESAIAEKISYFKNKVKFRELMQDVYPGYFYKAVPFQALLETDTSQLEFPIIVKPSVGFFSIAVHKVDHAADWEATVNRIHDDIERFASAYPKAVLDNTEFILESYVKGEEYAFDCYMDAEGNPVILNILHHKFISEADVSDRVYSTSKDIVLGLHDSIMEFLTQVQIKTRLKNFPLHIEIRVTEEGKLFPIEVNPMRFGGWCTTADVTYFAYGINSYLSFFSSQKPDWDNVFAERSNFLYSLILLDNALKIKIEEFSHFDYEALLGDFECPLHLRKHPLNRYGIFGFLFTRTSKGNEQELDMILHADLSKYINLKEKVEVRQNHFSK